MAKNFCPFQGKFGIMLTDIEKCGEHCALFTDNLCAFNRIAIQLSGIHLILDSIHREFGHLQK